MEEQEKVMIGIAGFGFVGQALYCSINTAAADVVIYDKYKSGFEYSKDELLETDYIFVCLPTPMDEATGAQDFTEMNEFLGWLKYVEYTGVVVIKSTVLYDNVKPFLEVLNVVINPEFLYQNSAVDDFANQTVLLFGGNARDCMFVKGVYEQCFVMALWDYQVMSHEEAINFKYIHNIYHAYQVIFWNYVYEVTGNHRKYTGLYEKMYGFKPLMSNLSPDGKKGYGGACFPKDVHAFNKSHQHPLTEFMNAYNWYLRGSNK